MAKLIIENSGSPQEIDVTDKSSIRDVCEENGVPMACMEGICGTCIIEVIEGQENLSPLSQEEKDFLGENSGQERLACQCKIKTGTVKIRF